MRRTILQLLAAGIALFVLGPLAGRLVDLVAAPDGGQAIALLAAPANLLGLFISLAIAVLAAGGGLIGGLLIGRRYAIFCAGLVLAWAGWGVGQVDEAMARLRTPEIFVGLAIDGAAAAVLGVLVIWLLMRLSRPSHHDEILEKTHVETRPQSLLSIASLKAVLAYLIAGGIAAWIVARTPEQGQTLAAAIAAGVGGGVVGRAASLRAAPAAFIAGAGLLAIIAPLAAMVAAGDNLIAAVFARQLIPLGWITPWMWLAGAMLGLPWGMNWADSMIETRVRDHDEHLSGAASGVRMKKAQG